MQALARLSVHRPVVATVLILLLVVVGGLAYKSLGVDRFPNVDFPMVSISTTLKGATPEEMDSQVTDEIEKQVNTVSGIDTLTSTSTEGVSVVSVQFVMEKDANVAAQEVSRKVDLAVPNLPKDCDRPVVQTMDTGASAVINIALSAKDGDIRDLTEYADKRLRPQIETINGVGEVDIVGGQARQINAALDPYALRSYGLSASDIETALGDQNLQVPGGTLDQGQRRVSVRTQGRTTDVDSLSRVIIAQKDGQPIRLSDVADVQDGEEEPESIANVNGKRAVMLSVKKQSGSNTVAVVKAVKERLGQLQCTLPRGYETKITNDQSTYIEASLDAVKEHLLLGAVLASLVVLIFLWNWRSAVIAALSIPTSLIATFALMKVMGFTLNMLTLLALTLAVGIVIDDAVIVLENIYRYLHEKNKSPREAALEATQEIGLAVTATTLSLVAVFVPIAFMSGMVGRMFQSFALTMAFAIMVSLLVAFTMAPMLCARWLRRGKPTNEQGDTASPQAGHSAKSGLYGRFEGGYGAVVNWALSHRWAVVLMVVGVLACVVPLAPMVKVTFIPDEDEGRFVVSVRAPEGTSLSATEGLMDRIAADIRKLPEVVYTVVTVADDAQATANRGSVDVHMKPVGERTTRTTQLDLIDKTRREILARYPSGLRTLVSAVSPVGGGGGATAAVAYTITGPDLNKVIEAGSRVVADIRNNPKIADADTSAVVGKPELGVSVNRDAAADLGVSVATIANSLRTIVAGRKVSDFAAGGELYDINLRAQPRYRDSADSLALFTVPSTNPAVGSVPLDQLVTMREGGAPSVVNRYNRGRSVDVSVNPAPGASEGEVQSIVSQAFTKLNLGSLYKGGFSGRSKDLGSTVTSFVTAVLLAVLFMYLILAAQFESWLYPLVILSVLPLTLPFAMLSLWLLHGTVNIFSMLGILVLFGMVKKNAILQVDHTNGLREQGLDRRTAIVTACKDRLRPILMTTIAFVMGMIPLALSTGTGSGTSRAMSHVIVGGQTLSLGITLIAVPVFYALTDDMIQFFARLRRRLVRAPEDGSEAA